MNLIAQLLLQIHRPTPVKQVIVISPFWRVVSCRMHTAAWTALRVAPKSSLRWTCRIIAGVQRPLPARGFHRSSVAYRIPGAPPEDTENHDGHDVDVQPKADSALHAEEKAQKDAARAAEEARGGVSQPSPMRPKGVYGSSRLRSQRNQRPKEIPPIVLPEWFMGNSVKCIGKPWKSRGSLSLCGRTEKAEVDHTYEDDASKYRIHEDTWMEVLYTLRADLALPAPKHLALDKVPRPVTVLQCPKDGGIHFLDAIMEKVADTLDVDLVRLDSQDIGVMAGDYLGESAAWSRCSIPLLSYSTQKIAGKTEEYEKEEITEEEEPAEEDGEDPAPSTKQRFTSAIPVVHMKNMGDLLKMLRGGAKGKPTAAALMSGSAIAGSQEHPNYAFPAGSSSQQTMNNWTSLKLNGLLQTILESANYKRCHQSQLQDGDNTTPSSSESQNRGLIIQIPDYKELESTDAGATLLYKLREAVKARWIQGQQVIIVGTTSAEDLVPDVSRAGIRILQADILEGRMRTIFVTPPHEKSEDDLFATEERKHLQAINIRNIEDTLRQLLPRDTDVYHIQLSEAVATTSGDGYDLGDAVWTFDRVHRIATTMIGADPAQRTYDASSLTHALDLLARSDEVKFEWGAAEEAEHFETESVLLGKAQELLISKPQRSVNQKVKQISKTCTTHEKKLLAGVIDPADLHTTFNDVRAPPETIEALKTLTTMSLIRPEAFSYGVLATDKIPGLLLYGPSGTGKTLLAKAVAKESGATVLEVSGSEMNDMYVGEGEKNVKALFSLAKKLSPCVVFIDEADAIFGSRGHSTNRASHRELINQFLREWDGMNDMSAFIMVATNRPFDLDDAVLRRLPRRLLVDLPVEADREAILKIHLKDEHLDDSVSLAMLASQTPYYSGSDLKNLSVAAALACVREENDLAAQYTGEEPYVYAEKRTLSKKHFDKAIGEISASVSEDMSTLSAIRKFDEKYGDRKGRLKKSAGLGFAVGNAEKDNDSSSVRVRK